VTGSTDPNQFQDPVDWCVNYGCANVPFNLPSPSPWVSNGGITGMVGIVGTLQPFEVDQQGTSWLGNFPDGMGVLYNGVGNGNQQADMAATFDVGVFGAGAYIQAENFGKFTATVTLFDINFQPLGSFSANGTSDNNVGTALFIGAFINTPDVYAIQFNVLDVNGNDDFGIGTLKLQTGQVGVPEPGTLLLLGPSALGLFGAMRRRMNRKSEEVL
jgi:hypothetical protein